MLYFPTTFTDYLLQKAQPTVAVEGNHHVLCLFLGRRSQAHPRFSCRYPRVCIAASQAAPVTLGEAAGFAVLSHSSVTNTGASVVYGNIGLSSTGTMSGFSSATLIGGTKEWNTSAALQARTDIATAYDILAGQTSTLNLSGQDLGGQTLPAGVYRFDSSAQLTGTLILDAGGDPDARFDFQIGTTLTTASGAMVSVTNGGNANNVYWQVSRSATIGINTVFQGNLLALTSITMTTGATNRAGRLLARDGTVTLDNNVVRFASVVPEAGTFALVAFGTISVAVVARRRNTAPRFP